MFGVFKVDNLSKLNYNLMTRPSKSLTRVLLSVSLAVLMLLTLGFEAEAQRKKRKDKKKQTTEQPAQKPDGTNHQTAYSQQTDRKGEGEIIHYQPVGQRNCLCPGV